MYVEGRIKPGLDSLYRCKVRVDQRQLLITADAALEKIRIDDPYRATEFIDVAAIIG